ncbi:MAG: hypothetical protein V4792_09090 [Pseudomonadota bacterium]
MLGLTTLGIVHTAISLVAVASGFWALARDKEVSAHNTLGRTYLVTTLLTAVTGLFIFQHGGFGPPHVLSILTILALAVGTLAALSGTFGRWSRYAQAISYSVTLLFHMIPGFTESLTRLPAGQPLLPNAEAPELRPIAGALFLLFVVGIVFQLRWLRAQGPAAAH